jgi:excisionase family DNA binding protein
VDERLLTFAEAAEVLNVPESWLREKVARRQVPHTRLGKHVRFTRADLTDIIHNGHHTPVARATRQVPRR